MNRCYLISKGWLTRKLIDDLIFKFSLDDGSLKFRAKISWFDVHKDLRETEEEKNSWNYYGMHTYMLCQLHFAFTFWKQPTFTHYFYWYQSIISSVKLKWDDWLSFDLRILYEKMWLKWFDTQSGLKLYFCLIENILCIRWHFIWHAYLKLHWLKFLYIDLVT